VLVVWSDSLNTIIPLCRDFDDKLIKLVWDLRVSPTGLPTAGSVTPIESPSSASSAGASPVASASDVQLGHALVSAPVPGLETKETVPELTKSAKPAQKSGSLWGWRIGTKASPVLADPENAAAANKRPMRLFAPVYGGLGAGLSICAPSVLFNFCFDRLTS
jgi:hypothetical protein